MPRPVRIVSAAPDAPCLSVDGAFGAPGLNLSHWPGNTTPRAFRHDLSTGSALAFAALDAEERERWLAGLEAIVNNHYDTDGTCALFAVAHPRRALPRASSLLDAARAGDFFEVPTERAFQVDCAVAGLPDPARSPLAAELRALSPLERWNHATAHWMEHLAALLDGDLAPYRALWEEPLESLRADRADLEQCERSDDPAQETTVFRAEPGVRSSRGAPAFDPGRHALFAATSADRVLTIGESADGTTYRFVVSTRSWFDLAHPASTPRPDLERWAATLNELEDRAPTDAVAWRFQPVTGASPELWFGLESLAPYAEHNGALRPSRLTPSQVLGARPVSGP